MGSNFIVSIATFSCSVTGIPIYFFSFYKAPEKVNTSLVRIQSRFLWGGSDEAKKIPWIKWETVCSSKEDGGLGVKNLRNFNMALLEKWRWRIMNEEDSIWKKILLAKYGTSILSPDQELRNSSNNIQSLWWRDLKFLSSDGRNHNWFRQGVTKVIGDGRETKFWVDTWIGQEPLCARFNRLFNISLDKDAYIAEKRLLIDSQWVWNWRWRRELFEWESNLLNELITIIQGVELDIDRKDCWKWKWDPSNNYTVRSGYQKLGHGGSSNNTFPYKFFWNIAAPTKMTTFAWRVIRNRIPTVENLRARGINVDRNNGMCFICCRNAENTNHLFCDCSFANGIWIAMLNWMGISSALSSNLQEHFLQFSNVFPSSRGVEEWRYIWFFTVWTIWTARNKAAFEGIQPKLESAVESIKAKVWSWIKSRNREFHFSFNDWGISPLNCL